jgi:hypothetical protein
MPYRRKASSRSSLVTMVKSANFRNLHHGTQFWRLNRPWLWSILSQCPMSPRMWVILETGLPNTTKGRFVEHQDRVEAFAPN